MCLFHSYILEKHFKDKFIMKFFSPFTLIDTMSIWENTDVMGQNGRGKVNRSRPTHYDIGMGLHYA